MKNLLQNQNKRLLAGGVLLSLLLSGCETVVNVDLPEEPSQIVVNSLFNPDTIWMAHISRSQGILESGPLEIIPNATVEVWSNNTRIASLPHVGNGFYKAANQYPQAGQTYEIRVAAPGSALATARDTAPFPTVLQRVDQKLITEADFFYEYECTLHFTDPPGIKNYYHLAILCAEEWEGETHYYPYFFASNDLLLNEGEVNLDPEQNFSDYEAFFDDVVFADRSYELTISFQDYTYNQTREIYMILSTVSEAYYKYHQSSITQRTRGDNPFSEPVMVYNNIENGLGIFAGSSRSVYKIKSGAGRSAGQGLANP
jgi:hypothetical protein